MRKFIPCSGWEFTGCSQVLVWQFHSMNKTQESKIPPSSPLLGRVILTVQIHSLSNKMGKGAENKACQVEPAVSLGRLLEADIWHTSLLESYWPELTTGPHLFAREAWKHSGYLRQPYASLTDFLQWKNRRMEMQSTSSCSHKLYLTVGLF